jgi:hypothetical protein
MTATADAELVRECRAGNPRSFETLVRKYEKPVYNLALRMKDATTRWTSPRRRS